MMRQATALSCAALLVASLVAPVACTSVIPGGGEPQTGTSGSTNPTVPYPVNPWQQPSPSPMFLDNPFDKPTEANLVQGYVSLEYPAMLAVGASVFNVSFEPGTLTANYTVFADPLLAKPELPLLFFLPIWNVEVAQFGQLTRGLASRGYTIVVAQTPQSFPFEVEGMPYPGCPQEQLVPSAAALSLFSVNADKFTQALGVKAGQEQEVVLLGARSGGWAALLAATGACDAPEALTDPEAMVYCNGWQGFSGSVRGVVLFEPSLNEPGSGFNLTGDAFVLWLAGHWDSENGTLASYQASQVEGGCSSFIKLRQMNSYGWVDYINNSISGQRPECAWRDPDEPVFYPTQQQQEEGVALQVGLIDAATRAAVLGMESAAGVLANIKYNLRVDTALGTECWA